MGLGRRPGHLPRRRPADGSSYSIRPYRRPRHRRPSVSPSADTVRHLVGQHLTSVGGAVTPLVLPVLVVIRLGATLNAYFYITWMLGLAFFMVSPSVATAVFAEGVRAGSDLGAVVARALRLIGLLLVPAITIMILGGRFILGLFGASYATAGYGLLVLLAISAIPDAVSNVAVSVFRVTRRLGYSIAINIGILVATLAAAWVLMPGLGIAGVGVAWLGAQTLGAIASLPAFARAAKPAVLTSPSAGNAERAAADVGLDPGVVKLIELASLQSLDRLSRRLP